MFLKCFPDVPKNKSNKSTLKSMFLQKGTETKGNPVLFAESEAGRGQDVKTNDNHDVSLFFLKSVGTPND